MRPFFRALLYILIATGTVLLVGSLVGQLVLAGLIAQRYQRVVFYLIVNSALLVTSGLMLAAVDRRSFHALGLWFYPRWVREALIGVGIGGGLIAAVAGFMLAGHWLGYQGFNPDATPAGFLRVAGFLFLAAAFEEILFRGYAFQRLVDSLGAVGAVALSSTLFGLAHLVNPSATALSTANTVLAGVLLSAAYLKTRGLWLSIGLHWAWNFFLGPIVSVPISGFRIGPMLLRAQIAGPEWLTGSTYGPEGSIILTGACIAAIVWLARTKSVFASPAMAEVLK
ncbi:MAG: CPBP family intramembrane metalloprotease [Acidobacteria bacterium]|nr:CPBP family intramembrane metalloprotease [Acidobacteriota bacterium]